MKTILLCVSLTLSAWGQSCELSIGGVCKFLSPGETWCSDWRGPNGEKSCISKLRGEAPLLLAQIPDRIPAPYDCLQGFHHVNGGCSAYIGGFRTADAFEYPKAEPVDVPAILDKACCTQSKNGLPDVGCVTVGNRYIAPGQCIIVGATCADKSRILLTDESGKKHCIKF